MSLETTLTLQLPVIDFTSQDLKPGTSEWDLVRGNVRRALEDFGCFEALFDKLPVKLRKAVFDVSEELFRLPIETKERVVSEIKYKGYVGHSPTNPLYEGVGIEFADNSEKVTAFTQKLWPKGNSSFSETVLSFTEQVSELDFITRRMIMETFGLDDKYIHEHLNSTKCQNSVADGIEVKTKDDKHWIKANASQDSSFIVLAGSMLHVLLNGRVLSSVHRVMRMGTNTRYSAGLFSVPKTEELIYAPEKVVDVEHPRLFKPLDFEAYFQFTTEESGRRDSKALRTYCGL
ncbi:probable 2-oxoglutarate-dependent dioxygenase AOP1.2 [Arabidopsis lyrata subsp. lyrata]|uniref:probable 2-oxoglutarate-dependent dioxygenase AOP1.2 n=1 Tax=Arabidopsis lyrata subsp. lyrata TaxID=81972 RepID=UPI000A29E0AC|nr:probable 2-oxoglutarate-dependent dioxygenase AOP1.2 [Arabidopsis lyrata subsp. lyrata]|eukprot:XP_020867734.1 probable 2-oxoglutarate-dependent dioxygenase AOP1.2 [Arabidopsis lyrata subsp. lyrata]